MHCALEGEMQIPAAEGDTCCKSNSASLGERLQFSLQPGKQVSNVNWVGALVRPPLPTPVHSRFAARSSSSPAWP